MRTIQIYEPTLDKSSFGAMKSWGKATMGFEKGKQRYVVAMNKETLKALQVEIDKLLTVLN